MIKFSTYLAQFKSTWGVLAALLGLSGTILKFVGSVNPPINLIEFSSVYVLVVSLLVPYLLYAILGKGKRFWHIASFVSLFPAIATLAYYLSHAYPNWVYSEKMGSGRTIIAIKGDKSCYTERALEYVETQKRDKGIEPSVRYVIEHFQVPNMDLVFTTECLAHARRMLYMSYVGTIASFQLAFCFFVLGEALPRNRPGRTRSSVSKS